MIGQTISHYKITAKLGAGGMGEVYLATDTKLDRPVALKFLPPHYSKDPEFKARFEHEAKAAAALNHPNIVTVHELGEHEGRVFIAMEHVEGQTLDARIAADDIGASDAVEIAQQVCEGLGAAHEAGVVHRDVKPANILIGKTGRAKILDFGLAKSRRATTETRDGTTVGTVQYESPEQSRGDKVDQRSDLFSLGVVLYEMVTSHRPFRGEYDDAVRYAIANENPDPLARYKADTSDDLQRVVSKLLEKDPELRYQSAAGVASDLKLLKRGSGPHTSSVHSAMSATGAPVAPAPRRRLLPILVPSSLVVIAIVVALVLKPWKIEVQPTQEAAAVESRLAIMYFDNLVDKDDPERLGEIVTTLLITDLSESQYVDVVSGQRLYDILKLLGHEGEKRIDREVATQVATKARAQWMVLGSIIQVEPEITVVSRVIDLSSGSVVASQRVTGSPGEKVFPVVDRLTVELKSDLSLPAEAQREADPSVADVTSDSPEAYRHYLEGMEHWNKFYFAEADASFQKALEYDSTFAMAYYWLAAQFVRFSRDGQQWIAKAVEYSGELTGKEKLYIESLHAELSGDDAKAIARLQTLVEQYPEEKEAYWRLGLVRADRLGQLQEAIALFNRAIAIDPMYKLAYNNLAYAYNEIGDFENSLWAINRYIELAAPDEANPYDTRGDLYAENGQIDPAIESYAKALEVKPDFLSSRVKLGNMYLFKQEFARAESLYRVEATQSDQFQRSMGRCLLAAVHYYRGKFDSALKVLDQGIAADELDGARDLTWFKHYTKAWILRDLHDTAAALQAAAEAVSAADSSDASTLGWCREQEIDLLATSGDIDRARAVADDLNAYLLRVDTSRSYIYWSAMGKIALAQRDFGSAVEYLEWSNARDKDFFTRVWLGRAYLENSRLGDAVTTLQEALTHYDFARVAAAVENVKAYYYLGLAYERSGWTQKAIEQYETFLDIWKDADPGIEEIDDARERHARLRGQAG